MFQIKISQSTYFGTTTEPAVLSVSSKLLVRRNMVRKKPINLLRDNWPCQKIAVKSGAWMPMVGKAVWSDIGGRFSVLTPDWIIRCLISKPIWKVQVAVKHFRQTFWTKEYQWPTYILYRKVYNWESWLHLLILPDELEAIGWWVRREGKTKRCCNFSLLQTCTGSVERTRILFENGVRT